MNVDQSQHAARRRGAAGADRHRGGHPGIRGLAPTGPGAQTPGDPRRHGDPGREPTSCCKAGDKSIPEFIPPSSNTTTRSSSTSTPRSDTGGACCRSIRWSARRSCRDGTRRVARSVIDRAWSGTAATAGRGRWDAEIAAACGRTWSCSSAGSCSPRSRTSWPATPRRSHAALAAGGGGRDRRLTSRSITLGSRRSIKARSSIPTVDQQHGPGADGDPEAPTIASGRDSRRRFVGTYSVVPGRTSTQASQTLIRAPGPPTRYCTATSRSDSSPPRTPSRPIGGVEHDLRPQYQHQYDSGPRHAPRRSRTLTAADVPTTSRPDTRRQHQFRIVCRVLRSGRHEDSLLPQRQAHARRDQPGDRRSSRSRPRSTRPTPASSSAT